jgi:hypothetical protein
MGQAPPQVWATCNHDQRFRAVGVSRLRGALAHWRGPAIIGATVPSKGRSQVLKAFLSRLVHDLDARPALGNPLLRVATSVLIQ